MNIEGNVWPGIISWFRGRQAVPFMLGTHKDVLYLNIMLNRKSIRTNREPKGRNKTKSSKQVELWEGNLTSREVSGFKESIRRLRVGKLDMVPG